MHSSAKTKHQLRTRQIISRIICFRLFFLNNKNPPFSSQQDGHIQPQPPLIFHVKLTLQTAFCKSPAKKKNNGDSSNWVSRAKKLMMMMTMLSHQRQPITAEGLALMDGRLRAATLCIANEKNVLSRWFFFINSKEFPSYSHQPFARGKIYFNNRILKRNHLARQQRFSRHSGEDNKASNFGMQSGDLLSEKTKWKKKKVVGMRRNIICE